MPEFKHSQPCAQCPWRRASAPGWLGDDTPEGFLHAAKSECHMPCHATIDYDDPNWKSSQLPTAPLCAGALIFLRNTGAMPRDPMLAEAAKQVERDAELVFANGPEFVEHHHSLGLARKTAKCVCGKNATETAESGEKCCADCLDNYCFGCGTVANPKLVRDCCGDLKCACEGDCMCGQNWSFVSP